MHQAPVVRSTEHRPRRVHGFVHRVGTPDDRRKAARVGQCHEARRADHGADAGASEAGGGPETLR